MAQVWPPTACNNDLHGRGAASKVPKLAGARCARQAGAPWAFGEALGTLSSKLACGRIGRKSWETGQPSKRHMKKVCGMDAATQLKRP